MNKRIQKKYLSDDERVVLRLFHLSNGVDFNLYDVSKDSAEAFAGILGKPQAVESEDCKWVEANKRIKNIRVSATAFLERGGI